MTETLKRKFTAKFRFAKNGDAGQLQDSFRLALCGVDLDRASASRSCCSSNSMLRKADVLAAASLSDHVVANIHL